jgi:S-adenosylmethionine/arginine decarboxylase-like enzyme
MTLHNQLLINGYTNNAITSEAEAVEWMQSLVDSINMKTIQGPYASYVTKDGNRGLTCVVMIETSHIALHVWDEPDPAEIQFDLYTCGELPVQDVINNLESSLGLFNYKYLVLEREVGFNQVMSGNGGFVL